MNMTQLSIMVIFAVLILFAIIYYWYQENKFKRMVEEKFNHLGNDVITASKTKLVLEGEKSDELDFFGEDIFNKDIYTEKNTEKSEQIDVADNANSIASLYKQLDSSDNISVYEKIIDGEIDNNVTKPEIIPEDSVEAFFIKFDNIKFSWKNIDKDLDLIIDIVFEDVKKLTILPEISQYTSKHFDFYVLSDKGNKWVKFEKDNKYVACGLRFVMALIDYDGLASQAQITNIYEELRNLTLNNNAHIRISDYESSISKLQYQVKYLDEIQLRLELYLIIKNKIKYAELNSFFVKNGLGKVDNGFILKDRAKYTIFTVTAQPKLENGKEYDLLRIETNFHLNPDPLMVVDKLFEFSEKFMQCFESRLLTADKQAFQQKDYEKLEIYLDNYTTMANKNGIELGDKLLQRLFM